MRFAEERQDPAIGTTVQGGQDSYLVFHPVCISATAIKQLNMLSENAVSSHRASRFYFLHGCRSFALANT